MPTGIEKLKELGKIQITNRQYSKKYKMNSVWFLIPGDPNQTEYRAEKDPYREYPWYIFDQTLEDQIEAHYDAKIYSLAYGE